MQLKVADILRVYNKLGMATGGTDHKRAYFWYGGKIIISTKLSHGSGDAKAINHIRQDFKLNEEKFRDLINCPLSKEGYVSILKEKRIIS